MADASPELQVRPLTRADLDHLVGWAEAEGWNPGTGDADAFWAADPGGFWGGELDGELVATVSLVRHGPEFGFVGFYIVRPDLRGAGHGLALWRAAVDASPITTLGLDGVPDQEANYERSGFVLAHRNARYTGTPTGSAAPGAPAVVDALTVPWERLTAFDAAHAAAPREAFLRPWLHGTGRVARAVLGADGALRGYAAGRPGSDAHRIGPVFAQDTEGAEALIRALADAIDGPIAVDVPLANAEAVALAERLGLTPAFQTARMYRGPDPGLPVGRIYGLTSLELG